jgi:protein-tyrosine phosphatase
VRYRVPCLLQEYTRHGFSLHHYPILDGTVPDIEQMMMILEDIKTVLECGNKAFIQLVV